MIAIALRLAAWATDPNFWLDEAMIYDALRQQTVLLPWTALSHYNQTTPYFLALAWKVMIATFGANEMVLRLPQLLAGVGGTIALWFAACRRLGPIGTGAAVLLAGLSETAIFQSAQFKQYSFEFLAAALILLAAVRLANEMRGKAPAWFAGISITVLPFSYCGPLVTGACGLGALTAHALREQFRRTDLRRLALLAALWASIVVLWQLIAVNPSTLLQFTGFEGEYELRYIALTRPASWLNVKQFIAVLEPALSNVAAAKIIALLCCVPWIVGAMIGWRRRIFEHVTCLSLVLGTVALSTVHVFPLAEPRKMLFVLPVFALSFGAAIEDVAKPFRAPSLSGVRPALALAVLAVVAFPFGLIHVAANDQQEEVAKVLRSVPQKTCPVIWAYYLSWPAVETYGDRQPRTTFIGQGSTVSEANGWTWHTPDTFATYLRNAVNVLARYPQVCLLFSHEQGVEKADILAALKPGHACSLLLEETGAGLYRCEPAASPDSAR